jgi:hypothetical protein
MSMTLYICTSHLHVHIFLLLHYEPQMLHNYRAVNSSSQTRKYDLELSFVAIKAGEVREQSNIILKLY